MARQLFAFWIMLDDPALRYRQLVTATKFRREASLLSDHSSRAIQRASGLTCAAGPLHTMAFEPMAEHP